VDLLVPASSEIVIEGHVMPGRTAVEGPMGEYAGYLPRHTSMQPEYVVDAITYRDDPIWPISVAGEPTDEMHTTWGLVTAAEALAQLRAAKLPVTIAWMPFESAAHWLVVCLPENWRELMPGVDRDTVCLRISQVLESTRIEAIFTRIFVLDDDIDPSNPTELAWAIATRVSPAHGRFIRHGMINPLAGCYSDAERRLGYGPKAVLNGLQPAPGQRNQRSSLRYCYPEAVQQRVSEVLSR
jgi:4-hydroxy-3-polyprenylbenzoate decarboxylase